MYLPSGNSDSFVRKRHAQRLVLRRLWQQDGVGDASAAAIVKQHPARLRKLKFDTVSAAACQDSVVCRIGRV